MVKAGDIINYKGYEWEVIEVTHDPIGNDCGGGRYSGPRTLVSVKWTGNGRDPGAVYGNGWRGPLTLTYR